MFSKQRLNVCILSEMYPPDVGGAETYAYELSTALTQRGHDVDVFTITSKPPATPENENLTVHQLFTRRKLPIVETVAFSTLARMRVDFEEYDVIHGTLIPATTIALSPGFGMEDVPIVVTSHGTSFDEMLSHRPDALVDYPLKYIAHPLNVVLDTISGHVADHVIAISDHARKRLTQMYRLPDDEVTVIPHGVDTEKFIPHAPAHPAIDPNRFTLFTVGRLGARKGVGLAIRGLATLDDTNVELLIAGTGRHEERLRGLADDLDVGNQVRFLGHVPDDQLPSLYATADAFTLTSRYEGFGLVLLEAMACGTPVVATDVGGVPSAVQDGKTGYLIPREKRAFADRVNRLTDTERREQMSANARTYAEANNWDTIAEQVEEVYESHIPQL